MSVLGIILSLGLFTYVHSQLQDNMLTNRLTVEPSIVKLGQKSRITIVVRNPASEEKITLKAIATYEIDGQQYTVESNEVTLTVDRSMLVKVVMNVGTLSVLPNTATYDGRPVDLNLVNSNNGTIVETTINVPNDNSEHTLSFEVMR